MKTGFLELRPIFVRKENRTRGHVFAAMLALKVVREGERGLKDAFGTTEQSAEALTLDDALSALSRLCFQRQELGGQEVLHLPRPDARHLASDLAVRASKTQEDTCHGLGFLSIREIFRIAAGEGKFAKPDFET